MSASEKLKALHAKHRKEDAWGNRTAEPIEYGASYDLAEALPQIEAVVEAAERNSTGQHKLVDVQIELVFALSALDRALTP